VSVTPGAGRARFSMSNVRMPDYFNIPNAFFRFQDPASQPAVVSFDVRFSGPVTDRTRVRDRQNRFEGTFLTNRATMTWSARTGDGWSFVSDASPTTSAFSMMGHERNGRFFAA
jgi:hypothetical protein